MPEKSTSVLDLLISLFISEKFIAAFIGLIAGTIATFVAPWTKWKFEKEKIKLENRKEKIKNWRDEISNSEDFNSFSQTSTFHELKDKLTKEELKEFDATWVDIGNHSVDGEKLKLGKFHVIVSQIEREWEVV